MVRVSILSALMLLGLASVAHAQPADSPEARVDALRELVMQARYGEAIEGAEQFLARTDLAARERNLGLEVLAIAQFADQQREAAARTLETIYRRDPGHRLGDPDASPPVVGAFARAREAQPTPIEVRLAQRAEPASGRDAPAVQVRIEAGADAVSEIRLHYRVGQEAPGQVVMSAVAPDTFVGRIPARATAEREVEIAYRIEAYAPSRTLLGALGSEEGPLRLVVAPEPSPIARTGGEPPPGQEGGGSVFEEWWFWVIVVAVVGGGVAAGILLGPAQDGPPEGTLGSVRLFSVELD